MNRDLFVGIDYSTKSIDIAALNEQEWLFASVKLDKQPGGMAGRGVREALERDAALLLKRAACVWVERGMFGSMQTTDVLAAVRGAILACLPSEAVVDTVRPSVWRAGLGMRGNMKRDQAKQQARLFISSVIDGDTSTLTDDQCEAACIAYLCWKQSSEAAQ